MITRPWRGWTASKDADAHERFLLTELFPSMRNIPGFRGADVLRHDEQNETAFERSPGSTHSMPSALSPTTTTKPQYWNQPPGRCSTPSEAGRQLPGIVPDGQLEQAWAATEARTYGALLAGTACAPPRPARS